MQRDCRGWGIEWDKSWWNRVLLPHRWSIVCQHQSAQNGKAVHSSLMAYWRGWAAFECIKPTAPSTDSIGLSLFIFLFISWESTFWFKHSYDSSHSEEHPDTQHHGESSSKPRSKPLQWMFYWHCVNIRRCLQSICSWHYLNISFKLNVMGITYELFCKEEKIWPFDALKWRHRILLRIAFKHLKVNKGFQYKVVVLPVKLFKSCMGGQ